MIHYGKGSGVAVHTRCTKLSAQYDSRAKERKVCRRLLLSSTLERPLIPKGALKTG